MNKEFYTAAEVAEICRVTVLTVYRWIKEKKIKAVKAGGWRIPAAEVDRLRSGKPAELPAPDPITDPQALESARRALEYAARLNPEQLPPDKLAAILDKLKG